uniref:Calcineurin-like phosphoesterase domain-containing protein n=1 Tax=Candidatus Methanomethylicus mesodigestus TaxID=1867258 RepID=A0A7C3FCG4_9CREN
MKFAHMADMHLGATSEPKMREIEATVLERAFGVCLEKEVDFVIISGDLFHMNIPDLTVVKEAVTVFKKFIDTGRKIYVVYGSHDFSPNSTSIIDILEAAGVIVRVGKPTVADGKLRPEVITDQRTGAKITGISGRRVSLEKEAFEDLDREYLRRLKGFKIFVFHTGLLEMRKEGEKFDGISRSMLPDGFDYYAGGHIHRVFVDKSKMVVYPGPLFTGWGSDLEATILGQEKRGFFLVGVPEGGGRPELEFVDLKPFEGVYKAIDATGKTADELNEELRVWATDVDASGKVVLLKVHGELSSGRTSDVDFGLIREILVESGAIYLHLNRNALRTREMETITVMGESAEEIERKVFREMAGIVKGGDGIKDELTVATRLLSVLRNPKREGESQDDYSSRLDAEARAVLGLAEDGGRGSAPAKEGAAKLPFGEGGTGGKPSAMRAGGRMRRP